MIYTFPSIWTPFYCCIMLYLLYHFFPNELIQTLTGRSSLMPWKRAIAALIAPSFTKTRCDTGGNRWKPLETGGNRWNLGYIGYLTDLDRSWQVWISETWPVWVSSFRLFKRFPEHEKTTNGAAAGGDRGSLQGALRDGRHNDGPDRGPLSWLTNFGKLLVCRGYNMYNMIQWSFMI